MIEAIVVCDAQADYCTGGAWPVPGADAVVEAIADHLAGNEYACVAFVKDWHRPDTDNGGHFNADPANRVPPHCLAGSPGARLHPSLSAYEDYLKPVLSPVFLKGMDSPGSSGFEGVLRGYEYADPPDPATFGLAAYLRSLMVTHVRVCGLTASVGATASDAEAEGFAVTVLTELTAGVPTP